MGPPSKSAAVLGLSTIGSIVLYASHAWRRRMDSRIIRQVESGQMDLDQARSARNALKWLLPVSAAAVALVELPFLLRIFG